jgi:anti-sigma factor RsiW
MMEPSRESRFDDRTLHAYYDGELGPLARWLFERRLARSAELRSELAALESVGDLASAPARPGGRGGRACSRSG